MNIIAYTIDDCFYCEQLKELFDRTNTNANLIKVGVDISRNEFKNKYPNATGYPYVIINEKPIGGLVETAKFFLQKGLITAKKNERS